MTQNSSLLCMSLALAASLAGAYYLGRQSNPPQPVASAVRSIGRAISAAREDYSSDTSHYIIDHVIWRVGKSLPAGMARAEFYASTGFDARGE